MVVQNGLADHEESILQSDCMRYGSAPHQIREVILAPKAGAWISKSGRIAMRGSVSRMSSPEEPKAAPCPRLRGATPFLPGTRRVFWTPGAPPLGSVKVHLATREDSYPSLFISQSRTTKFHVPGPFSRSTVHLIIKKYRGLLYPASVIPQGRPPD